MVNKVMDDIEWVIECIGNTDYDNNFGMNEFEEYWYLAIYEEWLEKDEFLNEMESQGYGRPTNLEMCAE